MRLRHTLMLAVLLVAAACGPSDASKAGGAAPVVLRFGTIDAPPRLTARVIQEYARQVESLSEGAVRIEPVWEAVEDLGTADWRQRLGRAVVDGTLDMGLVAASAWDTEGATSLRALTAPFLFDSDLLVAEVVSGPTADEMLAGLDPAGVTGLALVPTGLRHLFSFGEPMVTPEDVHGKVIRTPASATVEAVMEALGATAGDRDFTMENLRAGHFDGMETSFFGAGELPARSIAAGNLTLGAGVEVIVVNRDVFAAMSPRHREVLREAAAGTLAWAIAALPSDADSGATFCERGGRVVTATDDAARSFEEATRPVYDLFADDPVTSQAVEHIRRIRETLAEPRTAAECGTPPPPTIAPAGDDPEEALIHGVFRSPEWDEMSLVDLGLDESQAYLVAGLFTMTFDRGSFALTHQWAQGESTTCLGAYEISGGRVTVDIAGAPQCGPPGLFFSADFEAATDQLVLSGVEARDPADAIVFGAAPWQRIG